MVIVSIRLGTTLINGVRAVGFIQQINGMLRDPVYAIVSLTGLHAVRGSLIQVRSVTTVKVGVIGKRNVLLDLVVKVCLLSL